MFFEILAQTITLDVSLSIKFSYPLWTKKTQAYYTLF
jgi:hypothetical protein